MRKTNKIYLDDILNSIHKIEVFIDDMTFEDFFKDIKTQDAVIRNIEIIGEATNRLPEEFFTEHPSFPSKEAIAMRNFLIHDYDSIDMTIIWKTIETDIPQMKKEVQEVLSEK